MYQPNNVIYGVALAALLGACRGDAEPGQRAAAIAAACPTCTESTFTASVPLTVPSPSPTPSPEPSPDPSPDPSPSPVESPEPDPSPIDSPTPIAYGDEAVPITHTTTPEAEAPAEPGPEAPTAPAPAPDDDGEPEEDAIEQGLFLVAALSPEGQACTSAGGLLYPQGSPVIEGDVATLTFSCDCGGAQ